MVNSYMDGQKELILPTIDGVNWQALALAGAGYARDSAGRVPRKGGVKP